jgi:mono/diheme cytochrome c family protein
MRTPHRLFVVLLLSALLGFETASAFAVDTSTESGLIARGRYLAQVSGCNDCHTDGYLMSNGNASKHSLLPFFIPTRVLESGTK